MSCFGVRVVCALLLLLAPLVTAFPAAADDVVVLAAASLKDALDAAIGAYRANGDKISVSYAASSALAKRIESGMPADIFISADSEWMDYVEQRNLIKPETRKNLLGDHLVLVAPKSSDLTVDITPGFPLTALLKGGRLAIADPNAVPAGKYGKAALEKLGVWSSVVDQLAPAADVRWALFFVSRDESPLGIVYQTDAVADKGVKIVGIFPQDTHPPIIYPIALTAASSSAGAAKFLAFLESAAAQPFFAKQGFTVPP